MDTALYWFGLLHAAAYAIAGASIAMFYLVMWTHFKLRLLGPIMKWYVAKQRWDQRHIDGLNEGEWQRGEPKP